LLRPPGDDVGAALEDLVLALDAPAWDASMQAPTALPEAPSGAFDASAAGAVLARCLPENAIVVEEAATSSLPFYEASLGAPHHTILSLTGGAIGQGLPVATGAAIACPDRKVISFQADGSAAYTLQSLWTQVREGLDVVTLLCSNRAYRILQIELARAGVTSPGAGAKSLTQLDSPEIDWTSLARGFGMPAVRVESAEELMQELPRALAEDGPRFIELSLV
jgi:acetolactate synthase-1/2/3 large subunit